MVRRQRQMGDNIGSHDSYHLGILSLSTGAEMLANAVRTPWAVENEVDLVIGRRFRGKCRSAAQDNAPGNSACIGRTALTQRHLSRRHPVADARKAEFSVRQTSIKRRAVLH